MSKTTNKSSADRLCSSCRWSNPQNPYNRRSWFWPVSDLTETRVLDGLRTECAFWHHFSSQASHHHQLLLLLTTDSNAKLRCRRFRFALGEVIFWTCWLTEDQQMLLYHPTKTTIGGRPVSMSEVVFAMNYSHKRHSAALRRIFMAQNVQLLIIMWHIYRVNHCCTNWTVKSTANDISLLLQWQSSIPGRRPNRGCSDVDAMLMKLLNIN